MKATLKLASKPSRIVFDWMPHNSVLHVISDMLGSYNNSLADKSNKLRYRYIPGPFELIGSEKWLRHFADINKIELEVEYSFPPMPHN